MEEVATERKVGEEGKEELKLGEQTDLRGALEDLVEESNETNEKNKESILTEDEMENKMELNETGEGLVAFSNSLYDYLYILFTLFIAYYLGSVGFNFSWLIVLVSVFLRFHRIFLQDKLEETYIEYKKKREIVVELGPMKEEKTEWINKFLAAYYPNVITSHMVSEMCRSWLDGFVSGQLNAFRPPAIVKIQKKRRV